MAKWFYQCEYVKCGKPTCKRCPHGPYWYGYKRDNGKMKKKYCGKKDPREPGETGAEKVPISTEDKLKKKWSAIFDKRTASVELAKEIMQFLPTVKVTRELLRKQYRLLTMKYHPDRGGDGSLYSYINAANSWLSAYLD